MQTKLTRPKRKALVIGWDGGSYNVLDKMLNKGLMPNLRSLLENGVRAPFISTVPPITSPAWTSLRTGKTPANHGLFGFFKPPEGSLEAGAIERHTAESIKAPTFWNILNRHGKRVSVVDMPLTYPVEKIDGVMVSGMITRGKCGVLAYPHEVGEDLIEAFPDYFGRALTDGIDISAKFLDHLITSLEWKKQEDIYLMDKYEWDCFFTVFSAVDTLQHYFWKFMDTECVAYKKDENISKRIEAFYRKLDDVLGDYIKFVSEDDMVFVVSDHGFGPADYVVYVNNLLEEWDELKIKHGCNSLWNVWFDKTVLKKILGKLDFLHLRSMINKETRKRVNALFDKTVPIIWNESKAYLRANSEEGIYVNIETKFRNGVVREEDYEKYVEFLTAKLTALINPANGRKVFEFVKKRRDIHRGCCRDDAPDIILRPTKGHVLRTYKYGGKAVGYYKDAFLSGTHSQEGIFIAKGPAFKKNIRADAINIEDFTPILLHSLGVPIPKNLDGRVCFDIIEREYKESRPEICDDYGKVIPKQFQPTGRIADEDQIKRRLSQLGYID